jgi:hypothetical protein
MATDLQNEPQTSKPAEKIIRIDASGQEYVAIDRGDGRDQQARLMPGFTSNPGGRPKKKRFTEALNKYLDEHPEKLDKMIESLVDRGLLLAGTEANQAAVIVRDSIQGKPALTIAGDADNPLEVNLNDAKSKLLQLLGE